jgi:hypothetical protein
VPKGGPYYGDKEVVKLYNPNIQSLQTDFDEQIELYNDLVEPKLEADLDAIFSSYPAADNGVTRSSISILWVYLMTEEIQGSKGSTSTARFSDHGEETQSRYEGLLDDIRSGRKIIPKATRSNIAKLNKFTPDRVAMSQRSSPVDNSELFPKGLRR